MEKINIFQDGKCRFLLTVLHVGVGVGVGVGVVVRSICSTNLQPFLNKVFQFGKDCLILHA